MGRFDEWFADDASLMRKGTEHDSTQREETTTVEANEGSTTENGKVSTGPFSILEEHAATEADSHDNWPDNTGDSVTEVIEPDIAALPASLANREPNQQLKTRYNGHKALTHGHEFFRLELLSIVPDCCRTKFCPNQDVKKPTLRRFFYVSALSWWLWLE
ncbi:hypothetical protein ACVYSB_002504 [Escherichia albertii]